MPYLNLKLGVEPVEGLAGRAASMLATITAERLGKQRALTSVLVEFAPRAQWFVGGARAVEFATFYLDIKITEGTNTKTEKSLFQREAFAAMESLLGPVHPASYIVIHDVRADSWGYSGQTQEHRHVVKSLESARE